MISLFEKRLLRMKQELTDLKTATKRGLGTIRFYRYSISFNHTGSSTVTRYIKADVVDGEPGKPFIIPMLRSTSNRDTFLSYLDYSNATEIRINTQVFGGNQTVTCDIISSSMLENVRMA